MHTEECVWPGLWPRPQTPCRDCAGVNYADRSHVESVPAPPILYQGETGGVRGGGGLRASAKASAAADEEN